MASPARSILSAVCSGSVWALHGNAALLVLVLALLTNQAQAVDLDAPLTNRWWLDLGVVAGCCAIAGLMTGLNIGILSLDPLTLEVLCNTGTPTERLYAERTLKLLKHHHWFLAALLLGNAAAVEILPLFLDKVLDSWEAIIISSGLVLLFTDIIPTAIGSRYGLQMGGALCWLVYGLMALTAPISYPLAKVLDLTLGKGQQVVLLGRPALKHLVGMHASGAGESGDEGRPPLTTDEAKVIQGALDLHRKMVMQAMTPLDKVFMVEESAVLDDKLFQTIADHGHVRIPVYRHHRENIVGLLLMSDLLYVRSRSPPLTVKQMRPRKPCVVGAMEPLYEVLNVMQEGHNLAIVYDGVTFVKENKDPSNNVGLPQPNRIRYGPEELRLSVEGEEEEWTETVYDSEEARRSLSQKKRVIVLEKRVLSPTHRPSPIAVASPRNKPSDTEEPSSQEPAQRTDQSEMPSQQEAGPAIQISETQLIIKEDTPDRADVPSNLQSPSSALADDDTAVLRDHAVVLAKQFSGLASSDTVQTNSPLPAGGPLHTSLSNVDFSPVRPYLTPEPVLQSDGAGVKRSSAFKFPSSHTLPPLGPHAQTADSDPSENSVQDDVRKPLLSDFTKYGATSSSSVSTTTTSNSHYEASTSFRGAKILKGRRRDRTIALSSEDLAVTSVTTGANSANKAEGATSDSIGETSGKAEASGNENGASSSEDLETLLRVDGDKAKILERLPAGRPIGVITLEDVFEELIQEEIYDEKDVRKRKMKRQAAKRRRDIEKKARDAADIVKLGP